MACEVTHKNFLKYPLDRRTVKMIYYTSVALKGAASVFDNRVLWKTVNVCVRGSDSNSFSESLILAQNERW